MYGFSPLKKSIYGRNVWVVSLEKVFTEEMYGLFPLRKSPFRPKKMCLQLPDPPYYKKKTKKTPTYPILKFHVIGNTHFLFGLTEEMYELSPLKKSIYRRNVWVISLEK